MRKKGRLDTFHGSFNLLHRGEDLTEPIIHIRTRASKFKGVDDLNSSADQVVGFLDHVDMSEDEPCLGALGVKATFKCSDKAEVRVDQALGRILKSVVEEGVRGSVRHEGRDVQAEWELISMSIH